MAVEIVSWPSLHKRKCRTCGIELGPLACQADTLPIELPHPVYTGMPSAFITSWLWEGKIREEWKRWDRSVGIKKDRRKECERNAKRQKVFWELIVSETPMGAIKWLHQKCKQTTKLPSMYPGSQSFIWAWVSEDGRPDDLNFGDGPQKQTSSLEVFIARNLKKIRQFFFIFWVFLWICVKREQILSAAQFNDVKLSWSETDF